MICAHDGAQTRRFLAGYVASGSPLRCRWPVPGRTYGGTNALCCGDRDAGGAMTCPACGGAARRAIAPGYWECEGVVVREGVQMLPDLLGP
ncbi:MAG: hypothetical protein QOF73_401, partial [Thermomicrobiales bacterium]|nr:hypothetical protein [Thermomicrobiales bacterium]